MKKMVGYCKSLPTIHIIITYRECSNSSGSSGISADAATNNRQSILSNPSSNHIRVGDYEDWEWDGVSFVRSSSNSASSGAGGGGGGGRASMVAGGGHQCPVVTWVRCMCERLACCIMVDSHTVCRYMVVNRARMATLHMPVCPPKQHVESQYILGIKCGVYLVCVWSKGIVIRL